MPTTAAAAVTIVVITRDRAADLERTIPRHARFPVIVVDNGSQDASAAVAERLGARVVRAGRNLGAAGRTVGARLAGTPYVAFADDDSWWEPGCLDRAVAVLDAHPGLAVLAGRVLVGPERRLDPVCALMAASPLPARRAAPPGPLVLGFIACASVVRREAYLAVGGFAERYGVGGEEELLALDLASAGWDLAYVADVVVVHEPSPSRDPQRRRVVQVRNAVWTAWLRRPLPTAVAVSAQAARSRAGRAALREAAGAWWWVRSDRRRVPAAVEADVRLLA